jgi:hypothetical protein
VVADMRSDIEDEITRLHEPAVQPALQAELPPQPVPFGYVLLPGLLYLREDGPWCCCVLPIPLQPCDGPALLNNLPISPRDLRLRLS